MGISQIWRLYDFNFSTHQILLLRNRPAVFALLLFQAIKARNYVTPLFYCVAKRD